MRTISLKLPEALATKLREAARQRGASKSAIVREALAQYLSCSGPEGSFLALAEDLAGCVQGPTDLSVSKEYLKGYGR